ncbi:hypothetical protein HYW54_04720 [Candidatus Gottesmanbacteria bacterium]|nr:hypothetical protein [Candidatus Gottesmanbacteria bacterium]
MNPSPSEIPSIPQIPPNPPPNIPPPSPFPKKILILIGIVIVILLTITAAYFLGKSKSKQNTTIPSPTSVSSSSIPTTITTANWKTFTNSQYRYEIKIPQTWNALDPSPDFPNINEFQAPDTSSIRIMAEQYKTRELEMYLQEKDKVSSTAYEGEPSIKVISSRPITVSNYQAIEREEDWLAAGFNTKVTYLISGDKIVTLSLLPYAEKEITKMDAYLLYDQILQAFKFLDQSTNQKIVSKIAIVLYFAETNHPQLDKKIILR